MALLIRPSRICKSELFLHVYRQSKWLSNFSIHDKTKIRDKHARKAAIEDTVFQYAIEGQKRRDYCFGWGHAATGALGRNFACSVVFQR